MTLWLCAAIAFVVALALTPVVRRAVLSAGALDLPNERSSHTVPTPRSGGIAILIGAAAAVIAAGAGLQVALLGAATLLVAAIGLADDVRSVPVRTRFAIHVVAALFAALLAAAVVTRIDLPWLPLRFASPIAIAVTVFWVVGVTNGYNFMDGINGIASFEAIAAGVALAAFFTASGDRPHALLAIALAGGAAGFLPWNYPKAKIFMGDVASGALGFAFAALAATYAANGGSFIAAALVLAPFLFDTSITICRRIARRENITTAHRSHFYQRLVALGWSHATVSLLWFALAAGCALAGWRYQQANDVTRALLLGAVLAVHVMLALTITAAERRRN